MAISSLKLKRLVAFLLLIGLVVAVQAYVGWGRLLQPWLAVPLPPLAAAVLLVICTYGLRAVRLYDFFAEEVRGRFPLAFKLMLQHNFFNNLLPARSGEVAFPVLMQRYFDVPLARSVPALIWFRLLDLHTIALVGLWALGALWLPPWAILGLSLVWLSVPGWAWLLNNWLLRRISPHKGGLQGLLRKALEGSPRSSGMLFRAWSWTMVNWTVKLGVFAWVLALFVDVSLPGAVLGVFGGELTSVLPIHGVAGAGTYEAGIVAALLPQGLDGESALGAAVNLHLFLLGVTLIGGAFSLVMGRSHGR